MTRNGKLKLQYESAQIVKPRPFVHVGRFIMVERSRHRGKRKQELLSSHQRCWIWGRNVVLETLRAGHWPIVELRLGDTLSPENLESARRMATELKVPVCVESFVSLTKRCRSKEHQGYLAKMRPFPYTNLADVLDERSVQLLYVLLDSIQDPYNFGAIVRSASVLGVNAVFVASEGQSEVTSQVARSSAGAVNHIPIVRVDDLVALAEQLQALDITLVASTQAAECPLFEFDFCRSCAMIFGNEGTGIRDPLLAVCDHRVCIPQTETMDSLNAAVSAGILFYEARRQRTARQSPTCT